MRFTDAPIDSESARRLHRHGLRLGLVDTGDRAAFTAWLHAEGRGFYEGAATAEEIDEQLAGTAFRRTTAVWDDSAATPEVPVATVSTWPSPLSVPGERTVDAWAISAVTVAPTHRRRGIARALLESELRTAQGLGLPLAMLTASEATIYGRYGFAPAAMMADLEIVARRATWTGPVASGRVHFVTPEQLRDGCRDVFDRARIRTPGDVAVDDYIWARLFGPAGGDTGESRHLRAVRYDDADGRPQGFAVYRVAEGSDGDFANHTVTVRHLVAATDDAYAGLWRYLLELDLVSTVAAPLRSVDEPLPWQVADHRAVRRTRVSDHLWLRILDVPAALTARAYSGPGRLVLHVSDPLGLADGRFLMEIDAHGAATVRGIDDDETPDAPALSLSVNELAALYLGGTSAHTLVRAGRLTESAGKAADAVDASFRSTVTPWLSTWF